MDHHYNEHNDLFELQAALDSIGMPELMHFMTEHKVDYEVYQDLDNDTIGKILENFPVGLIRKFQIRYNVWKTKVSVSDVSESVSILFALHSNPSVN